MDTPFFSQNIMELFDKLQSYKQHLVMVGIEKDYEKRKRKLWINAKASYDDTLEHYKATKLFLEEYGFYNGFENYFEKTIKLDGFHVDIRFELTTPSPTICCAFNVLYCDCHVGCCGVGFESFIVEPLTFCGYIDKIIELEAENQLI